MSPRPSCRQAFALLEPVPDGGPQQLQHRGKTERETGGGGDRGDDHKDAEVNRDR